MESIASVLGTFHIIGGTLKKTLFLDRGEGLTAGSLRQAAERTRLQAAAVLREWERRPKDRSFRLDPFGLGEPVAREHLRFATEVSSRLGRLDDGDGLGAIEAVLQGIQFPQEAASRANDGAQPAVDESGR